MIKHQNMISGFPFFKNKSRSFIEFMSHHLKKIKISKEEVIFKENDPADAIYFIAEGEVGVVVSDQRHYDKPFLKIEQGNSSS